MERGVNTACTEGIADVPVEAIAEETKDTEISFHDADGGLLTSVPLDQNSET